MVFTELVVKAAIFPYNTNLLTLLKYGVKLFYTLEYSKRNQIKKAIMPKVVNSIVFSDG